MISLMCAILITSGMPEDTAAQSAQPERSQATLAVDEASPPKVRSPRELRAAAHELLKAQATETGAARREAVRGLSALYVELSHDTKMLEEDRLTLGRQIRSRLVKAKGQLEKETASTAKRSAKQAADDGPVRQTAAASDSYQSGGSTGNQGAAGGAAADDDAGEELVELIERTIAPDTWDVNGGPGTIRYFGPLRVLVVRQTDDAHDALADIIQQLRK